MGNSPFAFSRTLNTNIAPIPTYSWDVNVFSHEMGHNFGSRHTHNCIWNGNSTQIDDCGNVHGSGTPGSCYDSQNPIIPSGGGTIMSYCHNDNVGINFSLGFGQQPGDVIRNNYNNASCNLACCPMTLSVGSLSVPQISSGLYQADKYIESVGNVDVTENVIFRAGEWIELKSGFHAKEGGDFHAYIEVCQN